MNIKKTGQFIQTLRKEQNLTQKQLADKLGCTDKAISRWENGLGLPDVGILLDLSRALGVSVNEILSGEKIITEKMTDSDNTNLTHTVIATADETVIDILKDSQAKIKKKNKSMFLLCVLCVLQLLSLYVMPQIIGYIIPTFEPASFLLYSTVVLCIIAGFCLDKIKWLYPLIVTISLFAAIPFSGSNYYIYASTGGFALAISYIIIAICHTLTVFIDYIKRQ